MTLDQFRQLNEMEKVSAIMQHGHLMAQNVENNSRIFLYTMQGFYVSAAYSTLTDQLEHIECFLQTNQQIPHYRKMLISVHPAGRQEPEPEI
jgi:hypothetical protein